MNQSRDLRITNFARNSFSSYFYQIIKLWEFSYLGVFLRYFSIYDVDTLASTLQASFVSIESLFVGLRGEVNMMLCLRKFKLNFQAKQKVLLIETKASWVKKKQRLQQQGYRNSTSSKQFSIFKIMNGNRAFSYSIKSLDRTIFWYLS